jgi:hypothetical protein
MVHVGLHSVGTYHKKFGGQNKKNKKCFVVCPWKTLGKDSLCRVPDIWHSAKNLLCRVPTFGPRQRLTTVSCRRPLTDFAECFAVPSVLHSVNKLYTERRTLPSSALGKVFFAECPTKTLGKGPDSGSEGMWCYLPIRWEASNLLRGKDP